MPGSTASTAPSVTGTWNVTIELPNMTATPTMVLKQVGEKVTGEYVSAQYGKFPMTGTVKGTDVVMSFEMNVEGYVSPGGLGGPAILPLSMAKMAQMTKAFPDREFSGIGGVSDFRQALSYFLLGCGTVQVCTSAMLDQAIGPNVIKRLNEGRSEFGVPLLSKVPYVNRLFRNVGIGRTTDSLMMMVTPRIIIQEEEEERLGIQVP